MSCTIMLYKINKCVPSGSDTGHPLHEEGVIDITEIIKTK